MSNSRELKLLHPKARIVLEEKLLMKKRESIVFHFFTITKVS